MDLRVRRTQKNIREAFIALAEKKKISKITIKELAEAAMINKATFYLHYHDLEDLVSQLEDEIIHDIVDEIGKADSFFRRVEEFFQRFTVGLARHQKLLVMLYENDRTSSVQKKMVVALRRRIWEDNTHFEFTREMDIVLTFMLRGIMDISLYEEYPDREEVITALSNTIRIVTDHYRDEIHALRRSAAGEEPESDPN